MGEHNVQQELDEQKEQLFMKELLDTGKHEIERFRKPVEPGDQLVLTAQLERALKGIWRFSTAAFVGEIEVAHADMMVAPETGK